MSGLSCFMIQTCIFNTQSKSTHSPKTLTSKIQAQIKSKN